MKEIFAPPGIIFLNIYLLQFNRSDEISPIAVGDVPDLLYTFPEGEITAKKATLKKRPPDNEISYFINGIEISLPAGVFAACGGWLLTKKVFLTQDGVTVITNNFADPFSTRLRIVYPPKPR